MKKRQRSPDLNNIIIENCINAYVDGYGGALPNSIPALWNYLRELIGRGEISEPYAKIKAHEALDVIYGAQRLYKEILKNDKTG